MSQLPMPDLVPGIEVVVDGQAREFIALAPGDNVIGRSEAAMIRVVDTGTSRKHAKIHISSDGTARLVDLDSQNGTLLNGVLTRSGSIQDGDQIQVGSAWILRFCWRAPQRPRPEEQTREPSTRSALTKRELEIALLVAEGLTNPEIAGRLGISAKTVTAHLHNAFQRLSLRGRAALTRYLAESGLL